MEGNSVGTSVLKKIYSDTLRVNAGSGFFSGQSSLGTSYYQFNLTTPYTPSETDAGSNYPRGITRNLAANVGLGATGFGYLGSMVPNTNALFLNNLGGPFSVAQDGQSVPGLGTIGITGQDSTGAYVSKLDWKMNLSSRLALRYTYSGGTSNSGYASYVPGGTLTPLISQGDVWSGIGTIGTIPTGFGNRDINVTLTGKMTFNNVPFYNASNTLSSASLWVGSNGAVWRNFAAGDVLPRLGNRLLVNIGPDVAQNISSDQQGILQTYSGGGAALVVIDSPLGTSTNTTTAVPTSTTVNVGMPVTVNVTVTNTSSITGIPTGYVALEVGGVEQGLSALDTAGKASFTTSLGTGSYAMNARYTGDSNFKATLSTPFTQVVNGLTSNTSVTSSLNPAVGGQNVTFTVTVTGTGGPLDGSVTLLDGSNTLGSASVTGTGTATATISTSALSVGSHSITANYSGNSTFNPSASQPLAQAVNAGGFATPTPQSTPAGTPLTVNLTMFGAAGTNITYNLSASGLPANSSVLFTPNPVTPAAPPNGTIVQMQLTTHSVSPISRPMPPASLPVLLGVLALLAALSLIAGIAWSTPKRRLAYGVAFLAVALAATAMIGCASGSSNGSTGGSTSGSIATPKGAAAIAVTATPVGGGSTVTTTVNVTVQ
jgi:hypothetical protein